MQEWIDHNFAIIFSLYFVALWTLVSYWIALAGGWRLLAKRFRLQGTYVGQKWSMQSASMRWLINYNSALTVGADNAGLFIAPLFLFRAWHPPLFIPWTEVTVVGKTRLFFLRVVELRLGRSENIPFRMSGKLAARLEAAAGPGWPTGYDRTLEATPPPIGRCSGSNYAAALLSLPSSSPPPTVSGPHFARKVEAKGLSLIHSSQFSGGQYSKCTLPSS
jgi:hypothetical protein